MRDCALDSSGSQVGAYVVNMVWPFGFYKMLEISSLAKQPLDSQGGLGGMEFFFSKLVRQVM
jgi:hypothetical protein